MIPLKSKTSRLEMCGDSAHAAETEPDKTHLRVKGQRWQK